MNLASETIDSRFVTRKCTIVNDQSNTNYDVKIEVICNTKVLKCKFYDYSDAYILVTGCTIIARNIEARVAFSYSPFIKYMTKIDGIAKDDVEDLDLKMPMHILLENSLNYSDTTGS